MDSKNMIMVCIEALSEFSESLDSEKDTDLLNIRDEMMSTLNQLNYLLTLE
jgi:hypothetical protein